MIDRAASSDSELRRLLTSHPKIGSVELSQEPGIQFSTGSWHRAVQVGNPRMEVAGLVELIDNNPMVCVDQMSVPDAVSTLALIALGPLAWAGMILETPTVISSIEFDADQLDQFMTTAGWADGVVGHVESRDLGSVIAVTAMAAIATPSDWSEIDDLYDERFGRSFFVREDRDSEWDPKLVAGKPFAAYRLRYTLGEGSSLLTIQTLADSNGKCGRSQLIHAMNVMAGFEESMGIA